MFVTLRSARLRDLRRGLASACLLLLLGGGGLAGTEAGCAGAEGAPTSAAAANGHAHGLPSDAAEPAPHHGPDADAPCPMMALCTLSAPAPSMRIETDAAATVVAARSAAPVAHGVVLTLSPPPPRA